MSDYGNDYEGNLLALHNENEKDKSEDTLCHGDVT